MDKEDEILDDNVSIHACVNILYGLYMVFTSTKHVDYVTAQTQRYDCRASTGMVSHDVTVGVTLRAAQTYILESSVFCHETPQQKIAGAYWVCNGALTCFCRVFGR